MKKLLFDKEFGGWENSNLNLEMSHTQEQFLYRIYLVSIKSPRCLNEHCYCGCDTPALFLADKGCEGYKESNGIVRVPCYEPMMPKEQWAEYKRISKINILDIFEILRSKNLI